MITVNAAWRCHVDSPARRNTLCAVPPGEAARFIWAARIWTARIRATGLTVTSHLLPTYARVDLAFERGEGAWLIATNGERFFLFFLPPAAPSSPSPPPPPHPTP